jgi:hypothetical protein
MLMRISWNSWWFALYIMDIQSSNCYFHFTYGELCSQLFKGSFSNMIFLNIIYVVPEIKEQATSINT